MIDPQKADTSGSPLVQRARCALPVALIAVLTVPIATGAVASEGSIAVPDLPPGAEKLPSQIETTPLPRLLDGGWDIVSMASGLAGTQLLLRRRDRWILCNLGVAGSPPEPFTQCTRLNP